MNIVLLKFHLFLFYLYFHLAVSKAFLFQDCVLEPIKNSKLNVHWYLWLPADYRLFKDSVRIHPLVCRSMECKLKILNIKYASSHYYLNSKDLSTILENQKISKPFAIWNYSHPTNNSHFSQISPKIKFFNYLLPYFPIIFIHLIICKVNQFTINFTKMAWFLIFLNWASVAFFQLHYLACNSN